MNLFLVLKILFLVQLKKLGYEWLWVGDEFCTERKLYFIDDLIKDGETLATGAKIFTTDDKLLISPACNLSNLFICSSKSMIEKMREYVDFEGFYCTNKTEVIKRAFARAIVTGIDVIYLLDTNICIYIINQKPIQFFKN